MQAKFTMDPAQWRKANSEYSRIIQKAETLAVRDVGKIAVKLGRDQIAAAGFGPRWQKSLVVRNKPKSGYSFSPEATVLSTINFFKIFDIANSTEVIEHEWLWLPLPAVPPAPGRPHMTPKQFIAAVGPLVLMWRPGQPPMLGRQVRTVFNPGRLFSRATLKRGRGTSRGTFQTIPMFVGVKAVEVRKKWDITAACAEAAKQLPARYVANLENYK